MRLLRGLRRLGLWPRLAVALSIGFLALFGVFSLLSFRAISDSTSRILEERLVIAQMAAGEIDRLLERAFYELEKATQFARFDPEAPSLTEEYHVLAHTYGRVGVLSLGVYFLDPSGRVVLTEPPGRLASGTDLSAEPHVRVAMESGTRTVSDPFIEPVSGKPAVALAIPTFRGDGSPMSILGGLIDLSSPEVISPLLHGRELGHTGHAELVDRRGLIIASTDYGGILKPGEHPEFYLRMLQTRGSGVENVPYTPWHSVPEGAERTHHVMSFASLSAAPWGVGVGGVDWETFAPVEGLRNTILLSGAASLALLWMLSLVGARLLVRPIKALTGAAQRMATGDLHQPIGLEEGGEIAILADSLETMRVQLSESMNKVRRWGEELEVRVHERTKDLAVRNRQLSAVTAVATAANEVRDVEAMMDRCLAAILQHTRMQAGAVRVWEEQSNGLVLAASRGVLPPSPCRSLNGWLMEYPCGQVFSGGSPLYGTAKAQPDSPLSCSAARGGCSAVLPLKSPSGTLGVLCLWRSKRDLPTSEERETLAAICNQVAVALEDARLLEELGRMKAQQELDRLKAEFISTVSHELRTPLGFIKGYTTALLLEEAPIDAATHREFLQIVAEESDKLQGMIDDLLDTSRLQAGQLQVDRRPVLLNALLQAALEKASLRFQNHRLILTARPPHDDLKVIADPFRLEQVLHNLIENAIRYSAAGTEVEVGITTRDSFAAISVTDRGDGIPPEEVERIFEPFYRGANARKPGVRGAGLGLAICRGIVAAHGGRIWAESEPGQGSTFVFTLPMAQGKSKKEARKRPRTAGLA